MSVAANVKVAVRVRPMSERELKGNTVPVVNGSTAKNEVTLIKGAGNRQQRLTYNFDSVYTSFSTQQEVFQTVEPLVLDVMSGFEATVRSVLRRLSGRLGSRRWGDGSQPWRPAMLTSRLPSRRCSRTARLARARRTPWRVTSPPTTRRASSRALWRCVLRLRAAS